MTNLDIKKKLESPEKTKIFNLPVGSEAIIIKEIFDNSNKPIIHICKNDSYMELAETTLKFFLKDAEILKFPAWDTNPFDRVSPKSDIVSKRLETLSQINSDSKKRIIITSAAACSQKIIPKKIIEKSSLTISEGIEIKREILTSFLVENSYINVGAASEHGEFSIRGSIIDIFPPNRESGVRIDFFGDEVESIRTYDPLSQISKGKIQKVNLIPAGEIILNDKNIDRFKENYIAKFGVKASQKSSFFEAVSDNRKIAGIENLLPLFYEETDNIFNYFDDAIVTFENDVESILDEKDAQLHDSFEARKIYMQAMGQETTEDILNPDEFYLNKDEVFSKASQHKIFNFSQYNIPETNINIIDSGFKASRNYSSDSKLAGKNSAELLKDDLIKQVTEPNNSGRKNKIKNLIACMSSGSRDRIKGIFEQHEIKFVEINDIDKENLLIKKDMVGLIILPIDKGFKTDNFNIVSEADIFGEKIHRRNVGKNKKAENFLKEVSNLNTGELIVHKEYGIGKFIDMQTMEVQNVKHDFVLLEYRDGDKVYVPVENVDLISRYGSSEESTELDKLGGSAWQERTARVKKRIKEIAAELIKTAAEREVKEAESFHTTTGSYDEFCSRFPYAETDDQLSAIEQVLDDIASGKPMDRLVCGDVGFGKTEVAMRAAFAIVQDNKNKQLKQQVAVICPTTLLCRQHYKNFVERFSGFGFEIKQLSRMVSSKEARKTKESIKNGNVDIVIGTHALLAKGLDFKNLSRLVIDEEQRFGVAQKERLKTLKADTHVLTLTATPIPRTLQLSLSGIRELSLIATPPVDRIAVRTFVMPYDKISIREAILKEHYRGGRTYFVAPRIKDVDEMEKKLKDLIPEVKIVKAHGQMKPEELDEIMTSFYEGRFDVLLSTTIVESGLDVPAANTIIIHRADMFGLAQLYQLRGRVGRGKTRAFAYLTVPQKKQLTKPAEKRLEVMQRLDSLGAGFTLASYDMDIRGFGNLLGDEQSGNIREVGVELYQAMLKDEIDKLKASNDNDQNEDSEKTKVKKDFSTKINLGVPVLIPDSYVENVDLRMGLYRRLSELKNDKDVESFAVELTDRFGSIPHEVENLLDTIKIKNICKNLEIEKIETGEKGAKITFYKDNFFNPDALIRLISKNPTKFKIKDGTKLLIANRDWKKPENRIPELKKILFEIESEAVEQNDQNKKETA